MWRRLNREDLKGTNPLLEEEERYRPFFWRVFDDYELLPSEDSDFPYVQAVSQGPGEGPVCIDVYNPLVDTPYLFLEFARIWEQKNLGKALAQWIGKYGLLGYTQRHPTYSEEETPRAKWVHSFCPVKRYDDRGGPKDTYDLYLAEAEETNEALRAYEAALGRDRNKLETVLELEIHEHRRQRLQKKADATGATWIDVLVDLALWQVIEFSLGKNRDFAYPEPAFPGCYPVDDENQRPLLTIDQLTQGWGVRNLLGAIHLQFYWFVTSAGQVSRCKQCGRMILHASSIPEYGARKPRKDKEFCDSRCRQNYHYHTRIKPTLQKKKTP